MLDMTKLKTENVWKIVKQTRLSFLLEHSDQDCDRTLLSDKNIHNNINSLAAELYQNTTSRTNENISSKTLETAGEMFTYLNYCPSIIPKHALISAYLFRTGTPREIILGLTSAIKISQNVHEKDKLIEIFSNVMELLSLNNYENIQIITKGKCYTNTATFGNCTLKENVTNKEDHKLTGYFFTFNNYSESKGDGHLKFSGQQRT